MITTKRKEVIIMAQINKEITLAQKAGRNLNRYLQEHHIKQVDFANKIGRDTRTVRRWMYEGIPNLGDLELIVMALEVSVWDMLSDGEDVPFIFRDFIIERS